jgi:hypothetical protein
MTLSSVSSEINKTTGHVERHRPDGSRSPNLARSFHEKAKHLDVQAATIVTRGEKTAADILLNNDLTRFGLAS